MSSLFFSFYSEMDIFNLKYIISTANIPVQDWFNSCILLFTMFFSWSRLIEDIITYQLATIPFAKLNHGFSYQIRMIIASIDILDPSFLYAFKTRWTILSLVIVSWSHLYTVVKWTDLTNTSLFFLKNISQCGLLPFFPKQNIPTADDVTSWKTNNYDANITQYLPISHN